MPTVREVLGTQEGSSYFMYFMDIPIGWDALRNLEDCIRGRLSIGGWPTRDAAAPEEC